MSQAPERLPPSPSLPVGPPGPMVALMISLPLRSFEATCSEMRSSHVADGDTDRTPPMPPEPAVSGETEHSSS